MVDPRWRRWSYGKLILPCLALSQGLYAECEFLASLSFDLRYSIWSENPRFFLDSTIFRNKDWLLRIYWMKRRAKNSRRIKVCRTVAILSWFMRFFSFSCDGCECYFRSIDSEVSDFIFPISSRCQKQFSQYTCPRCNSRYCSVQCYKVMPFIV